MVLDPHCIDESFFTYDKNIERTNRFLFIGKLHPSKGAHKAISLCKRAGVPLDIVGPVTAGDPVDYARSVIDECDGQDYMYYSELNSEAIKYLLQRSKALIYPVNYPTGFGESHSHKGAEALMTGTPFIAFNQGAMSEVIEHGVTGFVANNETEFVNYMKEVDKLNHLTIRTKSLARWSQPAVFARFMPVIRDVSRGLRW